MKHSKEETEKLISDIENVSEFIVIKDSKLKKELSKIFKKVEKNGIESIMNKDGDFEDEY